ncbi:MAG: hypothetical protein ACPGJI_10020, partial [Kangiellaceae bacterium]
PKPACSSDQYRAFDFWLGEWEVTAKGKNKPHAKSSITKHNNGCSIHEHYVTSTGYTGNSLNFYDKANNKWHQTWIDNSGNPLYLDGQFKDGAMILLNTSNRITWTKNEAGMVNQVWETTADKGKTWKVIFDGSYKAVDSDKK